MGNPYSNLDDFAFWSRAMSRPGPGQIDPCTEGRVIGPRHKVCTMGSCFAQHLGRHIAKSGLCYHVAEPGPATLSEEERARRNYGVFSARYGNVYTVRQAVQLFDRAFGAFAPEDEAWMHKGRFVDPFRPRVEPDGFASLEDMKRDREDHLRHVREVFATADYLIFTLGLTEAWRSKRDGAVYPVAPGTTGGDYDPLRHEFVNFSASEVEADLEALVGRLRGVNVRAQVILTVSPVPLIATYERRHVWVSTTVSKAALRVAADAVERRHKNVVYFPSYEIITSPAAEGRYYADDLREVRDVGVKHVMRVFSKHFFAAERSAQQTWTQPSASLRAGAEGRVVCDEEVIASAASRAGVD